MFWPGYATPAQSPWGLAPDLNATTATASWSIHPPARSAFELPILRADVAAYQSSDNVSKPDTVDESSAAAALHAEIKEERISPLPTNDVAEKTQDMSSTSCNPADSITAAVDQSIRIRDNLTTTGWASPSARSPKSASLDDRNSPSPVLSRPSSSKAAVQYPRRIIPDCSSSLIVLSVSSLRPIKPNWRTSRNQSRRKKTITAAAATIR